MPTYYDRFDPFEADEWFAPLDNFYGGGDEYLGFDGGAKTKKGSNGCVYPCKRDSGGKCKVKTGKKNKKGGRRCVSAKSAKKSKLKPCGNVYKNGRKTAVKKVRRGPSNRCLPPKKSKPSCKRPSQWKCVKPRKPRAKKAAAAAAAAEEDTDTDSEEEMV